jgi:hypothetical protein
MHDRPPDLKLLLATDQAGSGNIDGNRQSGAVRAWLTPNHRSQFASLTAANALAISPFLAH